MEIRQKLHTQDIKTLAGQERKTLESKFWSKVFKTGHCWLFIGGKHSKGYGSFWFCGSHRAHRVSWFLLGNDIPVGKELDHICRTRSCVRPDHLEVVTSRENFLRGAHPNAIQAKSNTCKKGHSFSSSNTRYKADGSRLCHQCSQAYWKMRWEKYGK